MSRGVKLLRTIVQEGIRIQRGNPEPVNYVDARVVPFCVLSARKDAIGSVKNS